MQLFFAVEHNLTILQYVLRADGSSAFITTDPEIGLPQNAPDPHILAVLTQQKNDLGVDRILITRDTDFAAYTNQYPVKVIILINSSGKFELLKLNLGKLAQEIISRAERLMKQTQGAVIDYIDCNQFYKKFSFF